MARRTKKAKSVKSKRELVPAAPKSRRPWKPKSKTERANTELQLAFINEFVGPKGWQQPGPIQLNVDTQVFPWLIARGLVADTTRARSGKALWLQQRQIELARNRLNRTDPTIDVLMQTKVETDQRSHGRRVWKLWPIKDDLVRNLLNAPIAMERKVDTITRSLATETDQYEYLVVQRFGPDQAKLELNEIQREKRKLFNQFAAFKANLILQMQSITERLSP